MKVIDSSDFESSYKDKMMKQLKFFSGITFLFIFIIFLSSCFSQESPEIEKPTPFFTIEVIDAKKYIDPDNWFSINIPLGWKAETEDKYVGENGFLEIGYLPEFMFMQNSFDVCQWIANIDTKDTFGVSWFFSENKTTGCTLYPISNVNTKRSIIENPTADFPKRFLYIKTNPEHHEEIINSFIWLRPVDQLQNFSFPEFPLRPEDIAFWENTSEMPLEISLTEFALPQEAQKESPLEKVFLEFIPPDVPEQERLPSNPPLDETWEDVNKKIQKYGYELKPSSIDNLKDFYKNEEVIISNIYKISRLYQFSSNEGEKIALIVYSLKDPNQSFFDPDNAFSYVIQNDAIFQRKNEVVNPMDIERFPVLYEEEFLLLRIAKNFHVEVQTSEEKKFFFCNLLWYTVSY